MAIIKDNKGLSTRLGISIQTAQKWVKEDGFPGYPNDEKLFREFKAQRFGNRSRANSNTPNPKINERHKFELRIAEAKARKAELALQRDEGDFIPLAQYESAIVGVAEMVKDWFRNWADRAIQTCPEDASAVMERTLAHALPELCKHMQSQMGPILASPKLVDSYRSGNARAASRRHAHNR